MMEDRKFKIECLEGSAVGVCDVCSSRKDQAVMIEEDAGKSVRQPKASTASSQAGVKRGKLTQRL